MKYSKPKAKLRKEEWLRIMASRGTSTKYVAEEAGIGQSTLQKAWRTPSDSWEKVLIPVCQALCNKARKNFYFEELLEGEILPQLRGKKVWEYQNEQPGESEVAQGDYSASRNHSSDRFSGATDVQHESLPEIRVERKPINKFLLPTGIALLVFCSVWVVFKFGRGDSKNKTKAVESRNSIDEFDSKTLPSTNEGNSSADLEAETKQKASSIAASESNSKTLVGIDWVESLGGASDGSVVNFNGCDLSNIQSFEPLREMEKLIEIHFSNSKLPKIGFPGFPNNIRRVFMDGAENAGPKHCQDLRNLALTKLWLSGSEPGVSGCKAIAQITSLQHLRLAESKIDIDGFRAIASLSNLEVISLHGANLNDDVAVDFEKLKELVSIDLNDTHVGDKTIEAVVNNAPRIEAIHVNNSRITDASLELIAKVKNIKALSVSSCSRLTGAGLANLSRCKELELLNIGSLNLRNEDLDFLAALKNLEKLQIQNNKFDEIGLQKIRAIPNLAELQVHYVPISHVVLEKAKQEWGLQRFEYRD